MIYFFDQSVNTLVSSKILRPKDILVMLSLASVSGGYLDVFGIVHDIRTIQSVRIRWLQNRLLCWCQIFVHGGGPSPTLVAEIASAIHVGSG